MNEIENDIFLRTTLNVVARVFKNANGKYQYETRLGILPIDDVFTTSDSIEYETAKEAAGNMIFNFSKDVTALLDNEV